MQTYIQILVCIFQVMSKFIQYDSKLHSKTDRNLLLPSITQKIKISEKNSYENRCGWIWYAVQLYV